MSITFEFKVFYLNSSHTYLRNFYTFFLNIFPSPLSVPFYETFSFGIIFNIYEELNKSETKHFNYIRSSH